MLHLQGSIVAATMGRDPEPHLAEAAEQAGRLTEARPNTSVARDESFGPANVALWRMSAAIERREPGQVLAHAMKRDYRDSLYALLRAEHAAPQHVRTMTPVRELVGHMMRSARREPTTGDLGKLARRVGVVPA